MTEGTAWDRTAHSMGNGSAMTHLFSTQTGATACGIVKKQGSGMLTAHRSEGDDKFVCKRCNKAA